MLGISLFGKFGNAELMTDIQKLINAVRHGKVPPLKVLIEDENVDMYLTDSLGKNILHHAAIEGKEEILRWLIEAKSYDINIKDTIGMKMINYAALRKTKVAKSTEEKDQVDIFPIVTTRILYKEYNSQI